MDKKQITDEMRKILLEIEINKFDEVRKLELEKIYEELKTEYSKVLFEEANKIK